MSKPETLLPEDIMDLVKQTCLESVLSDAYAQATPISLRNDVSSSRRGIGFENQQWTASRHAGPIRHGSTLILASNSEERIFFRSRTHGANWDGHKYTRQVDSTHLFEELVATQKNAGIVAVRSLVAWQYQPRPEIITVESMAAVSFDESFELIRKSSRAVLALAGKA